MDEDGRIYLYREWYGQDKKWAKKNPDTGIRKAADWVGRKVRELEQEAKIKAEDEKEIPEHDLITSRVLSPDAFDKRGNPGPTVAEAFSNEGVYFRRADNDRLNGLWQCHLRLAIPPQPEEGPPVYPMFRVFETCTQFIRIITAIGHDEHNPEDVNKKCEDHPYEGWRYGMMSRPIQTTAPKPKEKLWLKKKKKRKRGWRTV